MPSPKRPFFPLYYNDFFQSRRVKRAGPEAAFYFLWLLSQQWDDGALPTDPAEISNLIGNPPNFPEIWKKIEGFFIETPGGLENERCHEHHASWDAKGEKNREAARQRWHAERMRKGYQKDTDRDAKGMLSESVSDSGSYPASDSVSPKTKDAAQAPPSPVKAVWKKPFSISDDEFPEALSSPEFIAIWRTWEQHRREIRKPLTPQAGVMALRELDGMGAIRAAAAIRHTIAKGWQGIREPDGVQPGRGGPTPYRSPAADLNKNEWGAK